VANKNSVHMARSLTIYHLNKLHLDTRRTTVSEHDI